MIDYTKLKIAHELIEKYPHRQGREMSLEVNFTETIVEYIVHYNPDDSDAFSKIDNLIAWLQEITQPKPKYSTGDILWVMDYNEPSSFMAERIEREKTENNSWEFIYNGWPESELYTTKQSLIEAQIEYWHDHLSQELKQHISPYCKSEPKCPHNKNPRNCYECVIVDGCEHESDGLVYCSNPPQNKCKKCGEFYR